MQVIAVKVEKGFVEITAPNELLAEKLLEELEKMGVKVELKVSSRYCG